MHSYSSLANGALTQASDFVQSLPGNRQKLLLTLLGLYGGAKILKLLLKKPKKKSAGGEKKRKGGKYRAAGKRLKMFIRMVLKNAAGKKKLLYMVVMCVVRAYITDKMANVQGNLFSAVFLRDKASFLSLITRAALLNLTLSGLESSLTYTVESLGLLWRQVINARIEKDYFCNMAYYKLSFVDHRVTQPEQRIANDLPKFTKVLSEVHLSLIRGIIDGSYFTWRLAREVGLTWAFAGWTYVAVAVTIVTNLVPNYSKLLSKRQQLEGEYRQSVTHLTTHSESIAAYEGGEREGKLISTKFQALYQHILKLITTQWYSGILEDFMYKYLGATVAAVIIIGPFFSKAKAERQSMNGTSQMLSRMRYTTTCIISQMIAIGNLAGVIIKLMRIRGYADRIGELVEVSKELSEQKTKATLTDGDHIEFENVTVMTPTQNVLIKNLNFKVEVGENLLVCGPNGAGKSSLFRCLGALWDIPEGSITKPLSRSAEGLFENVFYLPQKPYNVLGSLRDQITYPNTTTSLSGGVFIPDEELRDLLALVDLQYLMERDSEKVVNWEESLSIGETQRLAMARLFYHSPTFAILDECTSGVPAAMEDRLYKLCKARNITCITISHRPALENYHDIKLTLDGNGGYTVEKLIQTGRRASLRAVDGQGSGFTSFAKSPSTKGVSPAKYFPLPNPLQETKEQNSKSRLSKLMNLLVPSWMSGSAGRLALLFAVVVGRVSLSNHIAHHNGNTVSYLLKNDVAGFRRLIVAGAAQSMVQAFLAPTLTYLTRRLAIDWRKQLTKILFKHYLGNNTFYKVLHLHKHVSQAEQRMTDDVNQLCTELADLFPDVIKPVADIVWFTYVTKSLLGWKNTAMLYSYMLAGLGFLRLVTPDFSQLTDKQQQLEGTFRYVHSRLRTYGESVAFFGGDRRELAIVRKHFDALVEHTKVVQKRSWAFKIIEDFVTRKLPGMVTWLLSLVYSFRFGSVETKQGGEVSAFASQLGHDLRYVASAVSHTFLAFGELLELYKRFQSLSGYTKRVVHLLDFMGAIEHSRTRGTKLTPHPSDIRFDNVDVVTPDGHMLANRLSFDVKPEVNLAISGMTGSGKTSVFRMLAGLWPTRPQGGQVVRPVQEKGQNRPPFFFVPQKPYCPMATLADIVTYPVNAETVLSQPKGALMLQELLDTVFVGYLVEREGGWRASRPNWGDVLSLGEQQRLGMARLFFHRPRYAVLDQCTDAVSTDVEEHLYKYAHSKGITLITMSQRPGLLHLHQKYLQLVDGEGAWELFDITK